MGTISWKRKGTPRWRSGKIPATKRDAKVESSAIKATRRCQFTPSTSKIAEKNVPAWARPIQKTKFAIGVPQTDSCETAQDFGPSESARSTEKIPQRRSTTPRMKIFRFMRSPADRRPTEKTSLRIPAHRQPGLARPVQAPNSDQASFQRG